MLDTDWERIMNMSDEEAYQNALDDPDNPPLTEEEMANAIRAKDIPGKTVSEKMENIRRKRYKKLVSIRYDADVLEYFKAKGKGYQSAMNNALRAFMEQEKANG